MSLDYEDNQRWWNSHDVRSMGVCLIFEMNASSWASWYYSYDGFSQANALTEEVINPGRNMPLAITIGTLSVTAAYILVNLSYLCVLPAAVIISSRALAIGTELDCSCLPFFFFC
jgi:amino acid transporter